MTPSASTRIPNARSYWKASRYRSLDRYPMILITPKEQKVIPITLPISTDADSGYVIKLIPMMHSTADRIIYPVFAIRIGVVFCI